MKTCRKCKKEKPNDEFHKRTVSPDGLTPRCKMCHSEYDKTRANHPNRLAGRLAYQRTDRGKELSREANTRWREKNKERDREQRKRYVRENPKKSLAHRKVYYEIKAGNLIPEPCEVCQKTDRVHAHHDDYAKPLKVRWLCPAHHVAWHKLNGEGLNAK